jgi:hypothetical protein
MNGMRLAAVLLATVAATPALALASADEAKPAAKTCKKGTVVVKTGRKKRCVKLRVAPPRPKDADRGQLALDFLLSSKWPALRDRRGGAFPRSRSGCAAWAMAPRRRCGGRSPGASRSSRRGATAPRQSRAAPRVRGRLTRAAEA